MAFKENAKIQDFAQVGIVDYTNWQCNDCGTTGAGKIAYLRHQENCTEKGSNEKRTDEHNS